MRSKRWLFFWGLVCVAWSGGAVAQAEGGGAEALKWRVVDVSEEFRCFVKNWDVAEEPVMVRWIRSVDDWNATLGAAARGLGVGKGGERPWIPEEAWFAGHSLVVVAWVTDLDGGQAVVERADLGGGGEATVLVRRRDGVEKQSFTRKEVLSVVLPAAGIEAVKVWVNGEPVGKR